MGIKINRNIDALSASASLLQARKGTNHVQTAEKLTSGIRINNTTAGLAVAEGVRAQDSQKAENASSQVQTTADPTAILQKMGNMGGPDASVSDSAVNHNSVDNRLQQNIDYLNTSIENIMASGSAIQDVDMANEVSALAQNKILNQASTAMLVQANQAPQAVQQLLR